MEKDFTELINNMSIKDLAELVNNSDEKNDVEYMFWLADFVNDTLKIIESSTGIKHGLFNTLANKILWIKKSMEGQKTPNKMIVDRLTSILEEMNTYLLGIVMSHTNEEIIEAKSKNNK